MNSVTVIIADHLQLTRLGINCILKKLNYPVSIREISQPEKFHGISLKSSSNILITSASFLAGTTNTVFELLELLLRFSCKIIIRDQKIPAGILAASDELIEPNDQERIIMRKIDRQISSYLQFASSIGKNNEISYREKEVLRLVAMGLTNKEIAERLFISSHTVITHRKNISAKLGIKTIAGLTVYSVINKLISLDDLQQKD